MAIYPGGTFTPTTFGGKTPRTKGQRGILHVAVSNATQLPPWNENTWHFYVNKAGQAFQYVDTEWCAWASVDANGDAISIETQGGMGTSAQLNAEPWTPAQAARIADIMRWANEVEGIPLALLPDSKAGRRGWGTHRLGIDPWRVAGGQVWSNSNGKECPGDAKVAQVPAILAEAQGANMDLTTQNLTDIAAAVVNRQVDGNTRLWECIRDLHQRPVSPAVNVDASAVAAALASNSTFLSALAKAVNDDAAARLKS